MDIATNPDILVAVGDGHGIVVALVAHQGQRVDPRAQLVAGIERRRRWRLQRFAVPHKPFADALAVAAHDVALPFAALLLHVSVEGVPARKPGTRRHEVPPGKANHPLHITLVVALAGTAITILEQVMCPSPFKLDHYFGTERGMKMARERHSDEDILKLLREIEFKLSAGSDVQSACRGSV